MRVPKHCGVPPEGWGQTFEKGLAGPEGWGGAGGGGPGGNLRGPTAGMLCADIEANPMTVAVDLFWPATFGQPHLGEIHFWPTPLCVRWFHPFGHIWANPQNLGQSISVLLCVVVCCCVPKDPTLPCDRNPLRWTPPPPDPPHAGPSSAGPPKISLFFHLSRHNFHSFFLV